jgi:hypothetical protein
MIRKSRYGSLVLASLGWCKPDTVVCIEWVCEMKCEFIVAFSGSLPLKGQGID